MKVSQSPNTFNAKRIVDELLKPPHFSVFQLPLTNAFSPEIFDGFKKLLSEDSEYQKLWTVHMPESIKPDHGFIPPKGEGYDKKYFYHHSFDITNLLKERNVNTESYNNWLLKCDVFLFIFSCFGSQIIDELHRRKHLKDFNLPNLFEKTSLLHKMRLVKYLHQSNGKKNETLASDHYDQSAITFQWAQSHPGLFLGKRDQNPISYHGNTCDVVVFLGRKLAEATNDVLYKMPHYVDAPDYLDEDRYAGICFIHTSNKIKEHK